MTLRRRNEPSTQGLCHAKNPTASSRRSGAMLPIGLFTNLIIFSLSDCNTLEAYKKLTPNKQFCELVTQLVHPNACKCNKISTIERPKIVCK